MRYGDIHKSYGDMIGVRSGNGLETGGNRCALQDDKNRKIAFIFSLPNMQYFLFLRCSRDKKAFTVLELMVGIIIFTLGFLGAYLLVDSADSASIRSRDEIIGANVMREQIELLKNLRDTNWIQFRSWDSIELAKPTATDTALQPGNYYIVTNDFSSGKAVRVQKLSGMSLSKETVLQEFQKNPSDIRLCIDHLGRYVHDCSGENQKTNYASFVQIEPLATKNTRGANTPIPVDRGYKVRVFFASFNK